MEKYFAGEEISEDEIYRGLSEGIKQRSVFPILCGCAAKNLGVRETFGQHL